MFDATRLALLAQTACHMRYLRNHYLSLLCSPCIVLSSFSVYYILYVIIEGDRYYPLSPDRILIHTAPELHHPFLGGTPWVTLHRLGSWLIGVIDLEKYTGGVIFTPITPLDYNNCRHIFTQIIAVMKSESLTSISVFQVYHRSPFKNHLAKGRSWLH